MKTLKRYWIRFHLDWKQPYPPGILLGVGVTAFDRDDATQQVRERVFGGDLLPEITEFVENVSIASLDSRHVLPNLGNHFQRGIWYPISYV